MQARRATFEDLPQLTKLWEADFLPADDLEKRFTEFQVAVDDSGAVLGALGLRIVENHGLLHSEAISRPEIGDAVRELLWVRIQIVAKNHSLDRIWTRLNAPFWRATGFRSATNDEVEVLPQVFGDRGGVYLLLLRTGEAAAEALEKQFAMLRAMHVQESEQLQRRVSTIKKLAVGLTVVVALLVIALGVVVFRYGPRLLNR